MIQADFKIKLGSTNCQTSKAENVLTGSIYVYMLDKEKQYLNKIEKGKMKTYKLDNL